MTTIAASPTTSNGGASYVIAMKGHPGSGKSTLASAIAADLRCPLLDKDDIRDCTAAVQAAIADTEMAAGLCNELSYSVLWQLAETQLRLGLGVVVDCPLSRRQHFDRVSQVAAAADSRLLVVECRPDDAAEWRRRLERRSSLERDADVFRHKPATWEELKRLVDGYDGCWDYDTSPIPKLVVDTTAPHGSVHAVSMVRRWSKEMDAIGCSVNVSTQNMHISSVGEANVETKLSDPHPVHAKGTTKRYPMGIEHSKIQRLCATCRRHGHDSRTCPDRINERTDESNIVKQRICHECQRAGHDKRNCPKLRRHT